MVLVEILADSELSLNQREEEKKDWLPYILFCILSSRVICSRERNIYTSENVVSYKLYSDLFGSL